MENIANNIQENEKKQLEAIEKALRSYGYLFPQSDDEIESLDKIIGSTASPLPDSLKDTSFLFKKRDKKEAKIISMVVIPEPESCYHQAYAARDGESISSDTEFKMDNDIKKLKQKKAAKKK